jgi:DedD protein
MEDATPVVTLAPKLQPKPAVAPKPKVEKSAAYSETTNYGVKPPEDIDDEPPMKPKAEVKKGDKSEDALLKQIRAAKLLDDAPAAKTPAPVDVNVADVKKVLTPEQPKKAGRWFIQLASLTNKTKAETLQEGLKAQGLPVTLSQIQNDKGTFYRLRVGPELDGKRAAAMKKKMDEQGINSILVSE